MKKEIRRKGNPYCPPQLHMSPVDTEKPITNAIIFRIIYDSD